MVDVPEENDYLNDKRSGYDNDRPDEYVSGAQYRDEVAALTPRTRQPIGWQQKFAVVFLSLFGVSAVVLWAVQFRSGLQVSQPLTGEQLVDAQSADQAASDALLRNQDTDNDGLSDYLELALYNTSPYLEDTDSDGVNDQQEVDGGTDPNCPSGQDCSVVEEETIGVEQDISPAAEQDTAASAPTAGLVAPLGESADANQQAIADVFAGTVDAPTLRNLLKTAGMSGDLLDSISDKQLLDMYRKTLESQQAQ